MRPSRNQQINQALALLDRIVALIEAGDEGPAVTLEHEPIIPPETVATIRCKSPYWKDAEVRAAILSLYGRGSINDASALLKAQFGPERAPSRSILARLYAMIAEAHLKSKA
ncbi:hypothetical protein [Porphyrobacter sp. YT40]|uniref:hypothetical protein n=1 Tax=Porphyrobacter sp. YT40 TaxID=2547601 RepID=UPI001143ACC9|nr:hypothetical protein [Porphyrobacter sp. YT40]QDH35812.1 hypothetical protein E2E27_16725 [Porphyrobacter sp. YT40]